jgi:hypothetical protein
VKAGDAPTARHACQAGRLSHTERSSASIARRSTDEWADTSHRCVTTNSRPPVRDNDIAHKCVISDHQRVTTTSPLTQHRNLLMSTVHMTSRQSCWRAWVCCVLVCAWVWVCACTGVGAGAQQLRGHLATRVCDRGHATICSNAHTIKHERTHARTRANNWVTTCWR